jgi:hypothetical protein
MKRVEPSDAIVNGATKTPAVLIAGALKCWDLSPEIFENYEHYEQKSLEQRCPD